MGAAECEVVIREQHQQSNQVMSLLLNPIWWCLRPSTHDQMKKLSKWEEDDSSLASSSSSSDNQQQQRKYRKKKMKKEQEEDVVEPGSPKIGCMGQIKHHKQKQSNKIEDDIGIVSTAQLQQTICRRSTNHCNKNKYFKLKNIFPATTNSFRMSNHTAGIPNTTSRCNSSKILPRSRSKAAVSTVRGSKCATKMTNGCQFNYVDMDPPLPVIKKPQPQPTSEDEVSDLWRRRCGGGGANGLVLLKGLQIDKTKRPILQYPITM